MGRIFNPDNGFFRITGKLVDMVLLSILWAACSLPVFTIGPASAALYYAGEKCLLRGESRPYQKFFHSFRQNFKVGALTTLVVLAVAFGLLCLHNLLWLYALAGPGGYVIYVAFCVVMLLPIGIVCYLFPVLSRFTFGVGGLLKTCGKLAIAHLPSTVLLAVLLSAAVWACVRFWLPVVILPAVLVMLGAQLLERIFKPYLPPEPEEEEE